MIFIHFLPLYLAEGDVTNLIKLYLFKTEKLTHNYIFILLRFFFVLAHEENVINYWQKKKKAH